MNLEHLDVLETAGRFSHYWPGDTTMMEAFVIGFYGGVGIGIALAIYYFVSRH